ncbi:mismatch-specific DNA-glycosylase [Dehalogenimonas sp. THU2]|uniref:mismatch-specific DNA-glycosylase n=1 Tax=Dehalogenimonas sp. THU2 TaxID=3151121 RepID=UPI0032185895
MTAKLPDVLAPDLAIVFCGTAAGSRSAEIGAYYAGQGNLFWQTLAATGLTPRKLNPEEFLTLLDYRLGLTDLVKTQSGCDRDLSLSGFDIPGFCDRINRFRPKIIAFNGKAAAKAFFGRSVAYGGPLFDDRIGDTAIFVLPSTSGAARRWWGEERWEDLIKMVSHLSHDDWGLSKRDAYHRLRRGKIT